MISDPVFEDGLPDKGAELTAARIVHILQIYPKVSYSMLHIALGPTITASAWRPILDEMVAENVVQIDTINRTTPTGRSQTYSIISLVSAGSIQ